MLSFLSDLYSHDLLAVCNEELFAISTLINRHLYLFYSSVGETRLVVCVVSLEKNANV